MWQRRRMKSGRVGSRNLHRACTGNAERQFSVLSSQFSVLSSQFSVLSSQFSVLSSQFSVLSSQFSVLSWRSYGAEGCFGSCNSVGFDESSFRTECWLKDGRVALRVASLVVRRFVPPEPR